MNTNAHTWNSQQSAKWTTQGDKWGNLKCAHKCKALSAKQKQIDNK